MKYLITGGCGFLGANIARQIIEDKGHVVIFDNLSRFGAVENLNWLQSIGGFTFIHGDIRCQSDVEQLIQNECPDIVFHLAGQVAMTSSIENPRLDFEVNALGTLNLLESIRKYSPQSGVVYSSTNKVYGDLESFSYTEDSQRYICNSFPKGFPENISLDFHSPYGCSKGTADQYMLDFNRIYGIKTIVFRHSSMYGGRQFSTQNQGWIGWFCQKAMEARQKSNMFTISGNGKQVRDVLYVTDMVSLYLKAASNIEVAQGQAFNIGGGIDNSLSLLELFDILESEVGIKLNYECILPRESDQRFFVADHTKATEYFKWKPLVDKYSGIKEMLLWTQNNV